MQWRIAISVSRDSDWPKLEGLFVVVGAGVGAVVVVGAAVVVGVAVVVGAAVVAGA
jgi:hypothetical protein